MKVDLSNKLEKFTLTDYLFLKWIFSRFNHGTKFLADQEYSYEITEKDAIQFKDSKYLIQQENKKYIQFTLSNPITIRASYKANKDPLNPEDKRLIVLDDGPLGKGDFGIVTKGQLDIKVEKDEIKSDKESKKVIKTIQLINDKKYLADSDKITPGVYKRQIRKSYSEFNYLTAYLKTKGKRAHFFINQSNIEFLDNNFKAFKQYETTLVIPFAGEETATETIKKLNNKKNVSDVFNFGIKVAVEIQKIHQLGIVHSDIKPDNIRVDPSGVTIIDFGMARRFNQEKGGGAPGYTAPEYFLHPDKNNSIRMDIRKDIYAFGIIIAQALGADNLYLKLFEIYGKMEITIPCDYIIEVIEAHLKKALKEFKISSFLGKKIISCIAKMLHPNAKLRYSTISQALPELMVIDLFTKITIPNNKSEEIIYRKLIRLTLIMCDHMSSAKLPLFIKDLSFFFKWDKTHDKSQFKLILETIVKNADATFIEDLIEYISINASVEVELLKLLVPIVSAKPVFNNKPKINSIDTRIDDEKQIDQEVEKAYSELTTKNKDHSTYYHLLNRERKVEMRNANPLQEFSEKIMRHLSKEADRLEDTDKGFAFFRLFSRLAEVNFSTISLNEQKAILKNSIEHVDIIASKNRGTGFRTPTSEVKWKKFKEENEAMFLEIGVNPSAYKSTFSKKLRFDEYHCMFKKQLDIHSSVELDSITASILPRR